MAKTSRRDDAHLKSPYKVFLSHSSLDKWIAVQMTAEIERQDSRFKVFRDDRDISGGERIPEEIRAELKNSDELVILITPNTAGSKWVPFETGAFWMANEAGPIIPIRYLVTTDDVPEMIKERKSFELNNFDQYLKEIKARLR